MGDAFESVCAKALSLDPKERYPNAKALLGALDAALVADARGQVAVQQRVLLPESAGEPPEEVDVSRLASETTATSPPAVAAVATPHGQVGGVRASPSRMLVGVALVALIGGGVAVMASARKQAAPVTPPIQSPASIPTPPQPVISAASEKPAVPEAVPSPPARPVASIRNAPAPPASASPATSATSVASERIAALGTNEQKMQLKKQLEEKVYAGRGTRQDIGLLIFVCSQLGDTECVSKAVQLQATQ